MLLAASLLILAGAPSVRAEIIVGLTTDNRITLFDSATPGAATAPISITGLLAGESIVGIDRRPQNGVSNGLLYGLAISGGLGRIYTVNETTGAATLVSNLSVPLTGNTFGIDFNPVPDRLRVVSDLDQNLRINVDSGATTVDTPLAYASGDPNFGQNPNVVAAAYNNNFGGATTTTLRDIDSNLDIVAIQNPPNDGTLNTATFLPFNTTDSVGFDVSGLSGTPYFSFILAGESFSRFYSFSGGSFNFIGTVGTGRLALLDIAAPVGVPTPEGGPGLIGLLALGFVAFAGAKLNRRASV